MLGMVNILNFRPIELRYSAKFMTITFFSGTMLILTTLVQICWEWSIFWIFETMRKKSIEPRHCKNFITITFIFWNYACTTAYRQIYLEWSIFWIFKTVRRKPIQHQLYAKFITISLFLKPIKPWLCAKFMATTFFYKAQLIRFHGGKYIGNGQYFKFFRGSTKNRSNLEALQNPV